ncbi:MAG: serine/threonine protein kinase [Brotaphodocola sp.]
MKLCPNCFRKIENHQVCPDCGFKIYKYQKASHHLSPNTILNGKYLLGRVIGEGGFGITYVGLDLNLRLKVAIKEYFPRSISLRNEAEQTIMPFTNNECEDYQKGFHKFLDEARRLAQFFDLPNVARVKDFFQEKNTAYIVMEYIEGQSLKELVEEKGRLPMNEVLTVLNPILDSLQIIHKSGLLHRDISPRNIMIDKNGQAKLIDFGAARAFNFQNKQSNTVLVSNGFAPPEQYSSHGMQGPWTDVYGISATVYYAITGKQLLNAYERMNGGVTYKPSELGIRISPDQEKTLMKGLEVSISRRISDIYELKDGLNESNCAETRFVPKSTKRTNINLQKTVGGKNGTVWEIPNNQLNQFNQKEKRISSPKTHIIIISCIGILLAVISIFTVFRVAEKSTYTGSGNTDNESETNRVVYGKNVLFNGTICLFGISYKLDECTVQDFLSHGWCAVDGQMPNWEEEDSGVALYYKTFTEAADITLWSDGVSEPINTIMVDVESLKGDVTKGYPFAFQDGVMADSTMNPEAFIELFGMPDSQESYEDMNSITLGYVGNIGNYDSYCVISFDADTRHLESIWYFIEME